MKDDLNVNDLIDDDSLKHLNRDTKKYLFFVKNLRQNLMNEEFEVIVDMNDEISSIRYCK